MIRHTSFPAQSAKSAVTTVYHLGSDAVQEAPPIYTALNTKFVVLILKPLQLRSAAQIGVNLPGSCTTETERNAGWSLSLLILSRPHPFTILTSIEFIHEDAQANIFEHTTLASRDTCIRRYRHFQRPHNADSKFFTTDGFRNGPPRWLYRGSIQRLKM